MNSYAVNSGLILHIRAYLSVIADSWLVTLTLKCALCYLFRTNPRPRKHNDIGHSSKMSVGDTRLNNTHAVVLGHLQQIHQAELASTKAKLHHVSHALKSITELCQSDGITFTRCDGCRATHFADDVSHCEECHMRSCYACNNDSLTGGEVTVTGDRIYSDRAELCRDCREIPSLDDDEEEGPVKASNHKVYRLTTEALNFSQ